jgi:NADPH:quinone reductase-like Zn-dependent oxidoreductase
MRDLDDIFARLAKSRWPSWRVGCGCRQINAWRTPDAGKRRRRNVSKTILITGATNGIGLAAAEALASLGESIAVVGRNETRTKIAAAKSAGTEHAGSAAPLGDQRGTVRRERHLALP